MAGGSLNPQYAPIYVAVGAKYNIPAAVLAGVADVETNGGAHIATSSTGAQGLMQFEPGTARGLGVNAMDPHSAIDGAARLLLQYGYRSNPLRAIGAYNGGPGNPQYGYANLVMQNARRLAPFLKGVNGASLPAMNATSTPAGSGGGVTATTQNVVNQAGLDQARKAYLAGTFLQNEHNPFDIGPKSNVPDGLSTLFGPGLLSTQQPNVADFTTAQTVLQKVAGGTPLNTHPAATTNLNTGQYPTGVGTYQGTAVAKWIIPILNYARSHGWSGSVTSGYRSFAQQKAIYDSGVRPAAVPGTSNHEGDQFPRGAVDVSNAQQLSSILAHSPYASTLVYAGSKDPVHFSHPHNGGY